MGRGTVQEKEKGGKFFTYRNPEHYDFGSPPKRRNDKDFLDL